jgi:peptide/nickel transport system substrate-binding protein
MRRLLFQSAVVSFALALGAQAAVRPRYGGTVRVEMRAAVQSLTPAGEQNSSGQERLSVLLYEPLVTLDQNAQARGALAFSWQHTPDYKLWQFWLRPAKFHDGSPVTAAQAIAALTAANPRAAWRVRSEGESIIFESEMPLPNLPLELAQPKNAIVLKSATGELIGSGPFRIAEWQPGKHAALVANEDYWNGRPFLDGIEIVLDRPLREQMIDFELGRADVVEVAVDQARRTAQQSRRVVTSAPVEVFTIVFNSDRRAAQDAKLREALALSLDRKAIHEVLLQRQGEPAGSLLPQWISGYTFLFSSQQDLVRARQLRSEARSNSLNLSYDFADPLARSIAERVALNAREAGLAVQPVSENLAARTTGEARLLRVRLGSPDPAAALAALPLPAGSADLVAGASAEQVFRAEKAVVDSFAVIPIASVPEAYGLSPRVRNWSQPRTGGWPLAWGEVWVEKIE